MGVHLLRRHVRCRASTLAAVERIDRPHRRRPQLQRSHDRGLGDVHDELRRSGTPAVKGGGAEGTEGDDELSGTSGTDIIHLLGGDDLYNASGGNDSVYGEPRQDQLAGGGGNDLLDGGADGDQLIGGAGGDTLKGSGGNDSLMGDGVNAISGSQARPYLALSDPDILLGGDGADKLSAAADWTASRGGRAETSAMSTPARRSAKPGAAKRSASGARASGP